MKRHHNKAKVLHVAFEVSQFFVTNSILFCFSIPCYIHQMTVLSTSYVKLFDQILTWFSLAVAVVVTNGSFNLFMTDLMQDEEERSQTSRRGEPHRSVKLLSFLSRIHVVMNKPNSLTDH